MNLTLPKVHVSSAKADLADLGPRAKSAIADIELPALNLNRIGVPDLDGKGHAVAGSLSDAGQTVTGALSDAGKAVGGALGDAGQLVSGALSAAGDRLKDLRPAPEPKRRSLAPLAIGGVVVGAIAVAVGTAAAFLMDPIQGARRRAAVRRRVDGVAEHVRQIRGGEAPTKLLEAQSDVVAVPIEMGPGETPDVAANLEFTDGAVPVTAGAATKSQNGAAHSSDSTVAEAAGE
jgi:hypothetical protein